MSPVKRASSVDGLRRGAGTVPLSKKRVSEMSDDEVRQLAAPPARTKPPKDVRVTVNMDRELWRQLDGWVRQTADAMDVPRVGVQDAVRAMVRVITSGEARNAEIMVRAELRK
jgi:hypothetical protein